MDVRELNKWLIVLGTTNGVCFGVHAALSYGLTTVVPFGRVQSEEAEIFRGLAESLGFLGRDVQAFVTGHSVLARPEAFLLAYSLPLLITTVTFLSLLGLLASHRRQLDPSHARRLFRWAVAFAALSALATPVLVKDFWLSVGWGRIVSDGFNPYYVGLTSERAQGLPLDGPETRPVHHRQMTYGPLWAVVSGAVMWFAGERLWAAAALFKILLAGAWIASLRLIWLLLRDQSPWHQCVGLAIFGWLPLSLTQTLAEGHNDVFLVLLLLLWLYAVERNRRVQASLSLAASVLIKYVTAPLFLLDLLHLRYSRKRRLREYLPQLVVAAGFMAFTFGLFLRSADFFIPAVSMGDWRFYTPSDAVITLGKLVGVKQFFSFQGLVFLVTAVAVRGFFLLLALCLVLRYRRHPDPQRFRQAALGLMAGVLFGVLGHLWPWFLLWALAMAALVPGAALTRWVLGVALAAPFPILVWTAFPGGDPSSIPGLVLYMFALLWFVGAPRRWFPPDSTHPVGDRRPLDAESSFAPPDLHPAHRPPGA